MLRCTLSLMGARRAGGAESAFCLTPAPPDPADQPGGSQSLAIRTRSYDDIGRTGDVLVSGLVRWKQPGGNVASPEFQVIMPTHFDLIITADHSKLTAEFRLLDADGGQLAYRQTDFEAIPAGRRQGDHQAADQRPVAFDALRQPSGSFRSFAR